MKKNNTLFDKARIATKESKQIEFKEKFDITQTQDWCEIIKDIVSLANSGGGCMLIGVKNDGTPSNYDVTQVLNLDPAQVTDKIAKYTGEQFADFDIREIKRNGKKLAILEVRGVYIPMVFNKPGTYDAGGGKQHTAFSQGTIYFRHGAKSEPGNSKDLRDFMEKEINRRRKSWLGNIHKVVQAPTGHKVEVNVLPPEATQSLHPGATPIRIVEDPAAPAYKITNPDQTHPYRQKDVVQLCNQKLQGKKTITSHDIQCVRKIYEINQTKPNYFYKSKFATPQYSDTFVAWLIEQYEKNSLFFDEAREKYKNLDAQ